MSPTSDRRFSSLFAYFVGFVGPLVRGGWVHVDLSCREGVSRYDDTLPLRAADSC